MHKKTLHGRPNLTGRRKEALNGPFPAHAESPVVKPVPSDESKVIARFPLQPRRAADAEENRHLPLAVSPRDAAKVAGVGRSTIYLALASKELKSIKIGTRRLILVDAIREWLLAHQVKL